VRIWEEILGIDRVDANDSFFAVGGDSLSATRALSRSNETFRIEMPVRQLLESPSARAVAVRVFECFAEEMDESELSGLVSAIKDAEQDQ